MCFDSSALICRPTFPDAAIMNTSFAFRIRGSQTDVARQLVAPSDIEQMAACRSSQTVSSSIVRVPQGVSSQLLSRDSGNQVMQSLTISNIRRYSSI